MKRTSWLPGCGNYKRKGLTPFADTEVKIVVTDVMMPVMDGLKLARALRGIDAEVRVIASSGLDPASIAVELEADYIMEFLKKPYERHTLLAAVGRQLQVVKSRR